MGLWVALWVLLYLPESPPGARPTLPGSPTSVLHSFEVSKVRAGEGREVPARPGCGESAKPAFWHPCHGDTWPPAAEP